MIRRGRPREGGFTLVELSISIALMGLGMAFIVSMFMNSYRLWKKTYDGLILQRNTRDAMSKMVQALRQAHPGSLLITSPAGSYSQVAFTDARNRGWVFRREGSRLQYVTSFSWGGSTTTYMMSDVESLMFTFPNFQDIALLDVAITASKVPYQNSDPIVIQQVERVLMREP